MNSHERSCPLAPQASVSTNSTTPALACSFIIQERAADVKLLFFMRHSKRAWNSMPPTLFTGSDGIVHHASLTSPHVVDSLLTGWTAINVVSTPSDAALISSSLIARVKI